MKKKLPGWAVLLIITLAAGLALGGTYALTQEPIAQQALLSADNARKAALPDADAFEKLTVSGDAPVDWAYAGLKEGNTVGYVAQKTVNGFGGKVEVIAGVDTTGAPETFAIGGISVGGSSFSETAGLGARSKEPAFTGQFNGKVYPVSYIKAGGTPTESTVDALTSATITTTAVVNGVNDIVKYIKADVMGIAGVEMPAKPADGVFSASEKGFRGPVYVEGAFDGTGKVSYIKVGDESFAEDIGAGVVEPDFMIQFIGKSMPLEVSDIDVIAGATISSTAVVKALNNAYAIAGGAEITVPETPVMPEKPAEGVYSASANGFRGPVYVEAAFEDGKVSYIGVGDSAFAEDIGAGVKEPEFMAQFIGKEVPLEVSGIDVIAGATISSTAVVNALNEAYDLSRGIVKEAVEVSLPETPAEGVFAAARQGFGGPVAVEAAFDADGKITYIAIGDDSFAETAGLGARALEDEFKAQFIGKQMPLALSDIDALAGATVTSSAVVDALNAAYEKSLSGDTEETAQPSAGPETAEPAFKDVRNTISIATQARDIQVKVSFVQNTVAGLVVMERPAGSKQEYGFSELDAGMKDRFLAATLPLAAEDQDTAEAALVASAINAAYYAQGGAVKAKPAPAAAGPEIIGGADSPTAIVVSDPSGWFSSEVISFFTEIKVEARFEMGKVAALNVWDKPAGIDTVFAPSAQEEAMRALFTGKTLPLNVDQTTPYASAVAIALNQAFGQTGQTPVLPAAPAADLPADSVPSYGSCVMFFSQYNVLAGFDGGRLNAFIVYTSPAGIPIEKLNEEDVYVLNDPQLTEALIGLEMPLDPSAFSSGIGSVPAYAVSAVVIALNQAYENPAPGQQ